MIQDLARAPDAVQNVPMNELAQHTAYAFSRHDKLHLAAEVSLGLEVSRFAVS